MIVALSIGVLTEGWASGFVSTSKETSTGEAFSFFLSGDFPPLLKIPSVGTAKEK